jgi:RNA polymerase sigma factor (sigma-70 family)
VSREPLAHPEELIQRVYAYVAYRMGPGSDAEDVTSETMLRAVRGKAGYDPRRGKPISWLIGIARTALADHLAAKPAIAGEAVDEPSAENLEAEAVERLTIAAAVARLEPRDRELVALRYGADLATREIASIVGLNVNAVDVALHRCRARLRGELEDQAETPPVPRTVGRPTAEPSL